MAEEEIKETPKPKKKNGKAKAEDAVHQESVEHVTRVGAKTESMKTMKNVYPGRSFKMKTMADRNRL